MERSSAVITPGRFIPAMLMMVAIFAVSAQPGDHLHLPEALNFDKAWHFLEYSILAAACLYALQPTTSSKTAIALWVILFCALYGVSDEIHQSFVPLRTACTSDVIADTLGAALVAGIWRWRVRERKERSQSCQMPLAQSR